MHEISPIPSENLNDLHDIMTLMTYHFFARNSFRLPVNMTGTCPLSDTLSNTKIT